MLDDKTKALLVTKLKFNSVHIKRLEKNTVLLTKTLGLLELIKRSTNEKEIKLFVNDQFKRIKSTLNQPIFLQKRVLAKARAEYYSFQNFSA